MGRQTRFSGIQGWFGRDSGVNVDLRRGSPAFGVNIDARQAGANIIGVRPSEIHRYVERPLQRAEQSWENRRGIFHPDGAGGFRAMGDRIGQTFRNIFGGGRDRDDGYYRDRPGHDRSGRGANVEYAEEPRGRSGNRGYPREEGGEFQRRQAPAQGAGVDVDAGGFQKLAPNPDTLSALDQFQSKINSGANAQLSDRDIYTRVSQAWDREKPAASEMFKNGGFAPTRAGLNEFINFTREAEQNPGVLSLHQQMHTNPEMAKGIVDQWRKDVGADASSPSYKGGKPTILDRIETGSNNNDTFAAMMRAKNFGELQQAVGGAAPVAAAVSPAAPAVAAVTPATPAVTPAAQPVVQTPTGSVTLNPDNPSASTFSPAAAAPTPSVAYTTGTPMTTKMLNEMSAKGILPEARVPGMDDTTHLLADRSGKIVGGYTSNAQGQTQNFMSLDDVTKKLADSGKSIGQMETAIQTARNVGMKPAVQMADVAPTVGPQNPEVKAVMSTPGNGGFSV